MEFYLSKILNFFLDPLYILSFLILILTIIIIFIKSEKLIKFFSLLLLIFFLFLGYLPLSNFLLSKIEDYIQTSKYPLQQLKGIVVLGGSFQPGLISKERNQVLLNSSAERLTKALEIYNKNQKVLILFSGFSKELKPEGWDESQIAKKFFLDQGVKIENLILENQSRNTFENVIFSRDLIKKYPGTWGLITSASHMPRSFFGFKKQGIILEPINVDYKTGTGKMFWIKFDIENGIRNWSIILHEITGLFYYKITNKI
jgi:uncharacterized SAM-binding protein YcdF (DUF218 family)